MGEVRDEDLRPVRGAGEQRESLEHPALHRRRRARLTWRRQPTVPGGQVAVLTREDEERGLPVGQRERGGRVEGLAGRRTARDRDHQRYRGRRLPRAAARVEGRDVGAVVRRPHRRGRSLRQPPGVDEVRVGDRGPCRAGRRRGSPGRRRCRRGRAPDGPRHPWGGGGGGRGRCRGDCRQGQPDTGHGDHGEHGQAPRACDGRVGHRDAPSVASRPGGSDAARPDPLTYGGCHGFSPQVPHTKLPARPAARPAATLRTMPLVLRDVAAVVGLVLVLTTAAIVIGVLLVPRGRIAPLTRAQDLVVGAVFTLITRRIRDYVRRDGVLAVQAPVLLIVQLVTWLVIFALGYTLLLLPSVDTLQHALREAVSSLFTLGFTTTHGFWADSRRLRRGHDRPGRHRAPDRLPADAVRRVQPARDRGDAAAGAGRRAALGAGAAGPHPLRDPRRRPHHVLLGLGAVGGRHRREPRELPGPAAVQVAAPADLVARRPARGHGCRRPAGERRAGELPHPGPVVPADGVHLPAPARQHHRAARRRGPSARRAAGLTFEEFHEGYDRLGRRRVPRRAHRARRPGRTSAAGGSTTSRRRTRWRASSTPSRRGGRVPVAAARRRSTPQRPRTGHPRPPATRTPGGSSTACARTPDRDASRCRVAPRGGRAPRRETGRGASRPLHPTPPGRAPGAPCGARTDVRADQADPQTSSDPIGGPTDGPTDGPAGAAAAPPPGPFGPDGHPRAGPSSASSS